MSHTVVILVIMIDRELDIALRRLAACQHACVEQEQARRLGATAKQLRSRGRSPDWEALSRRVLRLVGSPRTAEQRCMAAALDARAVVSHTAAAALWGLPGFRLDGPTHVLRQRDGSRRPTTLAVVHRTRWLPPHHRTVVCGIPVTTVARTLFDLAGCIHPQRAERALENALNRKLARLEAVRAVTAELLEHGREGSAVMAELLAARRPGYVATASDLERAFLAAVDRAGLPAPVRQLDAGDDGRWVGRVDFAWPDRRLLIEVDSDLHHTGKLDQEADARRDAALRAAGFQVQRVPEGWLLGAPDEVATWIAAIWRGAGSALGGHWAGRDAPTMGTSRVPERERSPRRAMHP